MQGGIYNTSGARVAAFTPQLTSAQQPNAMACSSTGTVYVATNSGLLLFNASGTAIATPAGLKGLSPPIYGVYTSY